MNTEENSYSQVSQKDDQQAKELVNSYRFKSQSPNRQRVWHPNITQEEISKKKREREDAYIHQFDPTDRPILLIKKKDDFQNVNKEKYLGTPGAENYFKISENTQEVEDIRNQILSQSNFIRRGTKVYGEGEPDQDQSHLFKIEGIEFLPEGFLELDPLLYHDEYAFENEIHKELFTNEQRKLKALRRKQYQMRNKNKMREVTLYIADEKNEKVIDFLEKWYFKKKRRMNQGELEHAARELGISTEQMEKLQDLYLQHKKIQNTKDLQDYLYTKGRIQNNQINLPPSLQKYFVKRRNPYAQVKPRVYDKKEPYNPYKMNQWERKVRRAKSGRSQSKKRQRFADRIFNPSSQNLTQTKKHQRQKSRDNGFFESTAKTNPVSNNTEKIELKDVNFNPEDSQKYQEIKKSLGNDKNLQNYFDQEVNKILNKINSFEVEPPLSKSNSRIHEEGHIDEASINEIVYKVQNVPQQEEQPINPKKRLKANWKNSKKQKKPAFNSKNISKQNKKKKQPDQKRASETSSQKKRPSEIQLTEEVDNRHKGHGKSSISKKKPKIYQTRPQIQNQYFEKKAGNRALRQAPKLTPDRSSALRRLSLIYKNQNGDTVVIQKLEPVLIGNEYFFQSIEERMPTNGVPAEVNLVTRNQQGVIVKSSPLEMSNLGKFYRNKVFVTPDLMNKEKKITVSVQNEQGQQFALQEFTPNMPSFYKNTGDRLTMPYKNSKVFLHDRNLTCHILQPINIGDQYYQQVINEMIDEMGQKRLTILTHNRQGTILATDIIEGNFKENYSTVIDKDIINEEGKRQVEIKTQDANGNTLATHQVTLEKILNNNEELADQFQKGRITTLKKKGKTIRTYSCFPILLNNTFYKQKIYQETKGGEKKNTIITFNEEGEVVAEDFLDDQLDGKNYASVFVEENIENGREKLTLATKNERGETINLQELRPLFHSIIGERKLQDFDRKSRGLSTLSKVSKKGTQQNKSHVIRPTIFADQFYQQVIEEVIDGKKQKITVITKNEEGEILSKKKVSAQNLRGNTFQTFIAEIEDDPTKLKVITTNENDQVLLEQEIEREIKEVIDASYMIAFDKKAKGKNVIFEEKNNGDYYIRTYHMRPVEIEEDIIQQVILEIRDKYEENERILFAKNKLGQVIAVEQLEDFIELQEDQISQEIQDLQAQKSRRYKLVLFNDQGQEIGFNTIQLEDIAETRQSRVTFIKNKNENVIRHTLQLNQHGIDHYQQIVEELIKDDQLHLVIKNQNQESGKIEKREVKATLKSDRYKSQPLGSFIDSQGVKKTTIQILNDKNEVLGTFLVENQDREEIEHKFDDQKLSKLKKNTVTKKRTEKGEIILKRLRSTQVGARTYDCFFEEVIGPDGKKKLTLIMKNEAGETVEEKELPPKFISDNYEAYLVEQIDKMGRKSTRLEFRNSKRQLLHIKNFKLDDEHPLQTNYDEVQEIVDEEGNRCGSVFVFNEGEKRKTKIHQLRPTQVGSQFYQYTVNQLIEDGITKRATLIISNEKGEILKEVELDPKDCENYYYSVVDDIINDQKQRQVTVIIKNENGEVIGNEKIGAELDENLNVEQIYSNIVEELIEDQKRKKISVYPSKRKTKLVLDQIDEVDSKYERDSFKDINRQKKFEDLLKKYGGKSEPNRLSFNKKKSKNIRNRNQTFNALQNDATPIPSVHQDQSFNTQDQMELQNIYDKVNEIQVQQESPDNVFRDTKKMQSFTNNYYEQLKESKLKQNEDELKRTISNLLGQQKDQLIYEMMQKIEHKDEKWPQDTLTEFFSFCKNHLPKDKEYKESVMMISLFYFFMKKKGLKIKQLQKINQIFDENN